MAGRGLQRVAHLPQSERRVSTKGGKGGVFSTYFFPSQLSPSLSAVSFSSTPSCMATAVWTVPPASRWFP